MDQKEEAAVIALLFYLDKHFDEMLENLESKRRSPTPEEERGVFRRAAAAMGDPPELLEATILPLEIIELRRTLGGETDRGCALAGAAYLESQLEILLRAALIPDDNVLDTLCGAFGPLAIFSSRIDFAFALGLIPKSARRDLHLERKIRNEFAHSASQKLFTDPAIASRCGELEHDVSEENFSLRRRYMRNVLGLAAVIHGSMRRVKRPDPLLPELTPDVKRRAKKRVAAFDAALKEEIRKLEAE